MNFSREATAYEKRLFAINISFGIAKAKLLVQEL